jgi:DNA-binding CsgD family transcriptional regulator
MERLIDQVYEAAVMPDQWPELLASLGRRFDARGGLLFTNSLDGTRWIGGGEVVDTMRDFLSDGWMAHNERPARLIALNRAGFSTELDFMSEEETYQLPVFKQFLRPRGFFATAGTYVAGLDGDAMILSVEGFASHHASRAALPELDRLRPHLARAVQLASQFRLERMRGQVEALQAIGAAAGVLNSTGQLKMANARFSAELGGLFHDTGARLVLTDRLADRALADAVLRARQPGGPGRSIVVRSTAHGTRVLHVLPVRGYANDLFANASALLVLTNPSKPLQFSFHLIQQLFDLTPAEARLASWVANGNASLQRIAAQEGVSINTLKTQLQTLFQKTGTHRQADLVRLLVSSAAIGGSSSAPN